jgi:esterase/lipase
MIKFFSFVLNSTAGLFPKWNGSYAFNLMCKVKRTHKEDAPNFFLDNAIETKLHVDGFEATLYQCGTGPKKLLFLHGWKSHSARWEPLVALLDLKEYTCYAMDAPAHGRSVGDSIHLEIYRKFVVNTIKTLGEVHSIVAHSLGGLVTAYAFLEDPKLPVNKFIITGAPAGMQSIYDFFLRMVKLKPKVIENMDDYISKEITTIPALEIRMDSFFKSVDRPTLVIHDNDDRICSIEPIKTGVTANSAVETFFTSGFGHDLDSEMVYQRILKFLERNADGKY